MRTLQADRTLYETFHENGLRAARKYDRTMLALEMLKVLRRIRVLLLNQAFWPDVVATAQHADDLARFLRAHGDDVSVVASRAIYGERGATLPKRAEREGIQIYRVGLQLFGKRGITPRVFDFTLFYLAALWRCLILPRHDVVVCFTTPPFIAMVGVLLKWVKGTRLVYWTMDLYPEVAGAAGVMKPGSLLWNILRGVDRLCLRQSDRVVALGDYMREKVIEKGGDPERVTSICVWSGAEQFADRPRSDNPLRREWNLGDRFTVLYVGNFGLGHDMEAIAGAVERLKDDDSIRWLFIGDGKAKHYLEKRISDCGARNIFIGGYQTREQLADVLDVGDTHLVSLQPGWEGLILPSKFFSVLAAGKPVLWVGPERSECVTILNENRCGFQSQAGDGESLAREILHLAAHRDEAAAMGRRGKAAYESRYSSAHACQAWQDVLHTIVRPR
jgi:glycosyltransferase involved in cell wall biosynthesis